MRISHHTLRALHLASSPLKSTSSTSLLYKSTIPTLLISHRQTQLRIQTRNCTSHSKSKMSNPPVTPNIQNLLTKNALHQQNITAAERDLPIPPAKKYAVVTCMDARIHPSKAFGITLGDAHIIRNAGGSGVEALRSLVISQQLLGTEEVFIVKHTDCGMLKFDNAHLRSLVKERLKTDVAEEVDFLFYSDLEQSVKDDVKYLRGTGLLPESVAISGWVYEVETGKVVRVV